MILNIGQATFAQGKNFITKNNVSLEKLDDKVEGVVKLSGKTTNSKIKILVKKDDYTKWFDVDINKGKFSKKIYLTEGKGSYKIYILVNIEGRKYKYGPEIEVINTKKVNKFLVSNKHIESNNKEIIKLAKKITANKETDYEKAKAIYEWVIKNIEYDNKKYNKHLNDNYNQSYGALNTIKVKKGVCYDYATLVAALGRAIKLQTKVIEGKGITEDYSGLHAWNEIYISEKNTWIKLDTTFADTANSNYFDTEEFDDNHIKQSEY